MHILGIDANSIVPHLYQHLAVFALARPDQQFTGRSVTDAMDWMPLIARFMITCCN